MTAEKDKLLEATWVRYKLDGNQYDLEELARHYLPLVEGIARKVIRKRPAGFELDDLIQAGSLGLVQAIQRFDPNLGIKFKTFASRRIEGAMYDEINSFDWTPRLVRDRIKLLLRAREAHEKKSDHPPTVDDLLEIISEMGKMITEDQLLSAKQQAERTFIHPVDREMLAAIESAPPKDTSNSSVPRGRIHTSSMAHSVEEAVEGREVVALLESAIDAACTDFEREVIREVFFEGRSMKDVARRNKTTPFHIAKTRDRALVHIEEYLSRYGYHQES